MIIFGIDPGFAITGYGVIEKLGEIIDSNVDNIETTNDNINVLNDLGVKLDIIKFISLSVYFFIQNHL